MPPVNYLEIGGKKQMLGNKGPGAAKWGYRPHCCLQCDETLLDYSGYYADLTGTPYDRAGCEGLADEFEQACNCKCNDWFGLEPGSVFMMHCIETEPLSEMYTVIYRCCCGPFREKDTCPIGTEEVSIAGGYEQKWSYDECIAANLTAAGERCTEACSAAGMSRAAATLGCWCTLDEGAHTPLYDADPLCCCSSSSSSSSSEKKCWLDVHWQCTDSADGKFWLNITVDQDCSIIVDRTAGWTGLDDYWAEWMNISSSCADTTYCSWWWDSLAPYPYPPYRCSTSCETKYQPSCKAAGGETLTGNSPADCQSKVDAWSAGTECKTHGTSNCVDGEICGRLILQPCIEVALGHWEAKLGCCCAPPKSDPVPECNTGCGVCASGWIGGAGTYMTKAEAQAGAAAAWPDTDPLICWQNGCGDGQQFPTPGYTLCPDKTIWYTYEEQGQGSGWTAHYMCCQKEVSDPVPKCATGCIPCASMGMGGGNWYKTRAEAEAGAAEQWGNPHICWATGCGTGSGDPDPNYELCPDKTLWYTYEEQGPGSGWTAHYMCCQKAFSCAECDMRFDGGPGSGFCETKEECEAKYLLSCHAFCQNTDTPVFCKCSYSDCWWTGYEWIGTGTVCCNYA